MDNLRRANNFTLLVTPRILAGLPLGFRMTYRTPITAGMAVVLGVAGTAGVMVTIWVTLTSLGL